MADSSFDQYYADLYGKRWPALRKALLAPVSHVARLNGYLESQFSLTTQGYVRSSLFENTIEGGPFPQPTPSPEGLLPYYLMDAASIVAAAALDLKPGLEVLDLCAAPGGKTLIIAEKIGKSGSLIANDRSALRRNRLKNTIKNYVPEDFRKQIKVTGHDSNKWGLYEKERYDRVLLDAPCSSERHVLSSPQHLKEWSSSRIKRLAQQQYTMLLAGLTALKTSTKQNQTRLVYSTCAINHDENDKVIQKVLKKKPRIKTIDFESPIGERTDHGWIILPDDHKWGPIYFSVVTKEPD